MQFQPLSKFSLLILVTASLFVSCSKSSSSSTSNAPSADDAANMVSSSIQIGSGGFADQAGSVTTVAFSNGYGKHVNGGSETSKFACGIPFDTTITLSYSGPNVTASCTHNLEYTLNCMDSTLSLTGTFTGEYSGPYISGSRTGTKAWALSGFGPAYTVWNLNGTYNATGQWTMKTGSDNTYNNTIALTVQSVTIDKTTYRITGGSGTVAVTSVVSNGNTYTFNGTITFNGDHTATLIINGKTYTIFI